MSADSGAVFIDCSACLIAASPDDPLTQLHCLYGNTHRQTVIIAKPGSARNGPIAMAMAFGIVDGVGRVANAWVCRLFFARHTS
jgi:hypothetical protein